MRGAAVEQARPFGAGSEPASSQRRPRAVPRPTWAPSQLESQRSLRRSLAGQPRRRFALLGASGPLAEVAQCACRSARVAGPCSVPMPSRQCDRLGLSPAAHLHATLGACPCGHRACRGDAVERGTAGSQWWGRRRSCWRGRERSQALVRENHWAGALTRRWVAALRSCGPAVQDPSTSIRQVQD